MALKRRIIFNSETLDFETRSERSWVVYLRRGGVFLGSIALSVFYFWILFSAIGLETPKTSILRKRYSEHVAKLRVISSRVDGYEEDLAALALRDENVYRTIFGMESIPDQVRGAGFGGVDNYAYLSEDVTGVVGPLVKKVDRLTKMAYVQTVSYDEVAVIARQADNMAAHIPVIAPMNPGANFRQSSSFGTRSDPFTHKPKTHTGVDYSMPKGTPLYSTADGVVETVKNDFLGYGHWVLIDHGFGYKTRYAHMGKIIVTEGQQIKRGQYIGESGHTGRSTAPHLHYEVIFRGKYVNPYNFVDLDMDPKEYDEMIQQVNGK